MCDEIEKIMQDRLAGIRSCDEDAMIQCRQRWDSIAKPLRSLGKLEDAIVKIAGITGTNQVSLEKKALVILCADNGVVAEGVSQSGQEITALVAENFLDHNSCACIMAKRAGADVYPVDIGMVRDTKVKRKKVAYGTKNMAIMPAMSRQEALQAIWYGIEIVAELKQAGYQIIATGEMGIGNTTTSSAVASVLLSIPVEQMTGKGAGLSNQGLIHKIDVIEKAILLHKPDPTDAIDTLSKVGGLDLAGLTGIFLGGAIYQIPIVIDGFISSVAALAATKIDSHVIEYTLPSHVSAEAAGGTILKALGLTPFLTCDMCLGEGTGAVSLFPILDMAMDVYQTMSTFEQINMEAYKPHKL